MQRLKRRKNFLEWNHRIVAILEKKLLCFTELNRVGLKRHLITKGESERRGTKFIIVVNSLRSNRSSCEVLNGRKFKKSRFKGKRNGCWKYVKNYKISLVNSLRNLFFIALFLSMTNFLWIICLTYKQKSRWRTKKFYFVVLKKTFSNFRRN